MIFYISFLQVCKTKFQFVSYLWPWYLTFHAWVQVDIYCFRRVVASIFDESWLHYSMREDKPQISTKLAFVRLRPPAVCLDILYFCHFVEGYYWQQSPNYPPSVVCCHLNGENASLPRNHHMTYTTIIISGHKDKIEINEAETQWPRWSSTIWDVSGTNNCLGTMPPYPGHHHIGSPRVFCVTECHL